MEILKEGQKLIIHGLEYEVMSTHFLSEKYGNNDAIFKLLKIKDKHAFVKSIVGYKSKHGMFPYLGSMEDLTKVTEALINYNNQDKEEMYTNF